MDRYAIFVDAGYLFASGGLLCHGTRSRAQLVLDEVPLLGWLHTQASQRSGVPLLRTYWYDGARQGVATESQKRIGSRPGVKLRLGRLNSNNEQKGVDALIYRDLITLATERAITDAFLLSGDEDLREGVKAAQDRGVRVSLIGIPAPSGYNQSEELCREVDDQVFLEAPQLRSFISLVPSVSAPPPGLANPPSPADAGAAFAQRWIDRSEPAELVELLDLRPRIPRALDIELVRAVEHDLGQSLRSDDQMKRLARRAFWDRVESSSPTRPVS